MARSTRFNRSSSIASCESSGSMVIKLFGKLSLNSRNTDGNMYWHAVVLAPIRSRACPHLPKCSSAARAAPISVRILLVWWSNCSPACVSATFLPTLSKRRQPASRSSAFIEWLTADCDKCRCLAARVKLPVRARAANARSWRLSSGRLMIESSSSFPCRPPEHSSSQCGSESRRTARQRAKLPKMQHRRNAGQALRRLNAIPNPVTSRLARPGRRGPDS